MPRISLSPVPARTISGFTSDTVIAPTDAVLKKPSETGSHFFPPSVVFQTPPPVAPKKYSFGRDFEPVTAIERPPRYGPIDLHFIFEIKGVESKLDGTALVELPNFGCKK